MKVGLETEIGIIYYQIVINAELAYQFPFENSFFNKSLNFFAHNLTEVSLENNLIQEKSFAENVYI